MDCVVYSLRTHIVCGDDGSGGVGDGGPNLGGGISAKIVPDGRVEPCDL